MRTVTVLGAGIQGVCAALALRAEGWRVRLVDQAPGAMLRASLRNEGKIHLGFIYANDPSFRTGRLMVRAALAFAPLIERWVGRRVEWGELRSRPFTYLVMQDSMLTPDEICAHYERLEIEYRATCESWHHYLGVRPESLWRKAPPPPQVDSERVAAAVRTAELAVDLVAFRRLMVGVVDESEISLHFAHRVESVARTGEGFAVEGVGRESTAWTLESDAVVNCLWEGRLKIDKEMGIEPNRPWVYRLKFRVLGELPQHLEGLPSLSLVLGPYGDIVPIPGSSYISWYPVCRRGWSKDLTIPESWQPPCNGQVDRHAGNEIASQVYEALEQLIPGIGATRTTTVDAGIVASWGDTDVDQPDSELHERFVIGVTGSDGYFSIDTGKFGCAPLFAAQLAEMI